MLIVFTSIITILGLTAVGLAIWALATSSNIQTKGKATLTALIPHFAFGWIIGLIIYHTNTKNKLAENEELAQAAKTGNILGIVLSIVYGIILAIIGFTILVTSGLTTLNNVSKKPRLSSPLDSSIINEEEEQDIKSITGDSYKISMPCAGTPNTQKDAASNTNMTLCIDISNGTFVSAETKIPQEVDTTDQSQMKQILEDMADSFFRGANGTKLSTEMKSSNILEAKGKHDKSGQEIRMQFRIRSQAGTGRSYAYQLGILAPNSTGLVNETKFANFIQSFRYL